MCLILRFGICVVILINTTEVLAFNSCSFFDKIDCMNPGLGVKDCFCDCLNATINRDFLKISYSPCFGLLQGCSFYRLWFEIRFVADNGDKVAVKEVSIDSSNTKLNSQIIPLYELTNLHQSKESSFSSKDYLKLELHRHYTVSIQPKCTLCDHSCNLLQDMEIPAILSQDTPEKEIPQTPIIVTVISAFVVACTALVVILICRRLRRGRNNLNTDSNQESMQFIGTKNASNNANIAIKTFHQLSNGHNSHNCVNNIDTYHRDVQHTVNIIPLCNSKYVEELHQWLSDRTKCKCKIISPAQMISEWQEEKHLCRNTINLFIIDKVCTFSYLKQQQNNHFEDVSCSWLSDIISHLKSYPNIHFLTFESDLQMAILNFDSQNILTGIMERLLPISLTCTDDNSFDKILSLLHTR